ncbi:unnamed protein product, partial [Discosporangium mesarthrocarpum]
QVGIPADRAQYIHRLGRTARAGKGGAGLTMLMEAERAFLDEASPPLSPLVSDLPLVEADRADPGTMVEMRSRVGEARGSVSEKSITKAYQGWLGFYKSNLKRVGWSKADVVQEANYMSTRVWGMGSPPGLKAMVVEKMGLNGVAGIRVMKHFEDSDSSQGGGSNGAWGGGSRSMHRRGAGRGRGRVGGRGRRRG